jgi:hypothetical protein
VSLCAKQQWLNNINTNIFQFKKEPCIEGILKKDKYLDFFQFAFQSASLKVLWQLEGITLAKRFNILRTGPRYCMAVGEQDH